MSKRILLSLLTTLFVLACGLSVFGQTSRSSLRTTSRLSLSLRFVNGSSEREQDGLNGPVRRVRTETAKLSNKNGKLAESQRVTLEVAAYDIKGAKIENAYFPVNGAAITGKEVYKYDDKGNIMEMTLQDEKGTLLSKETYTYEFDQFGNWTKMMTSVAVIENGKITFEPTEVTYRTISYYLDEATLAKMNQPAAPAVANSNATGNAANTGAAGNVAANKNASLPAASVQPSSSAPSKPVAQTGAASNDSSSASKQPSQSLASNNKPAATSDASKQSAPSSNTSAPIVKTSAPLSDKPVESKSSEEQGAKPVMKPLLKPISGGVLNGKAINLPKPNYPPAARSARMMGLVVVEVVIDVNGKVISARAVSGPSLLQQAAVQAAYQAKFSPTLLSDQPVKVVGTINYNFALAQ
ncbi:MAG TPA: TonB family protein [Pyrinomonadaceae bacterium]|jgi:TonB family protein